MIRVTKRRVNTKQLIVAYLVATEGLLGRRLVIIIKQDRCPNIIVSLKIEDESK